MLSLSLFGLMGPLPPRYTAGLNFGCGLSGVVICVCRGISLVILPTSDDGNGGDKNLFYGALLYLSLAALILIFNVAAIVYMVRMPFTQYHLERAASSTSSLGRAESRQGPASPKGISTRRLFKKVVKYEKMRRSKTSS